MSAVRTLVDLLAGRRDAQDLAPRDWDGVIGAARAEALLATLAHRLANAALPPSVAALFADQRAAAAVARAQALWEAEMARRALAPEGIAFVLLKGTAYAAAGLSCAEGRQIGDLDILVGWHDIGRAENELIEAGWEWVKPDPYDDAYYREHMHELPPLIHKARDRMIDVHHTIFHCLTRDFAADAGFWGKLDARAALHGLRAPVQRAARLARDLYGAALPPGWNRNAAGDGWFVRRLLARDDWGRPTHFALQQAFYIRSHWLRMPPVMLAKHLWTKWRKS